MEAALTGEQIRAARAMLRLNRKQMASLLSVPHLLIQQYEKTKGPIPVSEELFEAMRVALLDAGIELINSGTYSGIGGPGVRMIGEPAGVQDLIEQDISHSEDPPDEVEIPA